MDWMDWISLTSLTSRSPDCDNKTSKKHLSITYILTWIYDLIAFALLSFQNSFICLCVEPFGIFVNVIIVALVFSIKWFIFKFFLNTLTIMNLYHLYLVWASI